MPVLQDCSSLQTVKLTADCRTGDTVCRNRGSRNRKKNSADSHPRLQTAWMGLQSAAGGFDQFTTGFGRLSNSTS